MSITLNIVGLMIISDLINYFINPFLLFGIGFILFLIVAYKYHKVMNIFKYSLFFFLLPQLLIPKNIMILMI